MDAVHIFEGFRRSPHAVHTPYIIVFPQLRAGFGAIPVGFDSRQLHHLNTAPADACIKGTVRGGSPAVGFQAAGAAETYARYGPRLGR